MGRNPDPAHGADHGDDPAECGDDHADSGAGVGDAGGERGVGGAERAGQQMPDRQDDPGYGRDQRPVDHQPAGAAPGPEIGGGRGADDEEAGGQDEQPRPRSS